MQRPRQPHRTAVNGRRTSFGCVSAHRVLVAMFVVVGLLVDVPPSGASTRAPVRIIVTASSCARAWTTPQVGKDSFLIVNRTTRNGAVYLFNPYTGVTVAERTALAPSSRATLDVKVEPGNYTWSCHLEGEATRQSTDVTVRPTPVITAAGPTTEIPVAPAQLAVPVSAYRVYVSQQLSLLVTEVAALRSSIAGGQLGPAEAAWLTAHLTWQRIGAAYDAFGTLGTLINGLAVGQDVGQTPGTPGNTPFEGFHKIERDLWGEQSLSTAGTDAAQLASNVATLVVKFAHDTIAPAELPLRTHEILEDSLRDELSGDDDYGSGTDMASVEADVSGTEVLLHLLAPLIDARAPELVSRVTVQLNRLDAALAATQQGGRWVAVDQVPLAQREQVDGAIGAALEILAVVPDIMPVIGSTL
jgi:high-affinity iron transporter